MGRITPYTESCDAGSRHATRGSPPRPVSVPPCSGHHAPPRDHTPSPRRSASHSRCQVASDCRLEGYPNSLIVSAGEQSNRTYSSTALRRCSIEYRIPVLRTGSLSKKTAPPHTEQHYLITDTASPGGGGAAPRQRDPFLGIGFFASRPEATRRRRSRPSCRVRGRANPPGPAGVAGRRIHHRQGIPAGEVPCRLTDAGPSRDPGA